MSTPSGTASGTTKYNYDIRQYHVLLYSCDQVLHEFIGPQFISVHLVSHNIHVNRSYTQKGTINYIRYQ